MRDWKASGGEFALARCDLMRPARRHGYTRRTVPRVAAKRQGGREGGWVGRTREGRSKEKRRRLCCCEPVCVCVYRGEKKDERTNEEWKARRSRSLPGKTSLVSALAGWIHPFLCWIIHWNMAGGYAFGGGRRADDNACAQPRLIALANEFYQGAMGRRRPMTINASTNTPRGVPPRARKWRRECIICKEARVAAAAQPRAAGWDRTTRSPPLLLLCSLSSLAGRQATGAAAPWPSPSSSYGTSSLSSVFLVRREREREEREEMYRDSRVYDN